MLVELGLVEQRHKAVLEVLDGSSVVDVARRYGVSRQSVHAWLRRYANQGLSGLADRSSDAKVVRVHAARHDPAKEHGAFATPNGRPRRPKAV